MHRRNSLKSSPSTKRSGLLSTGISSETVRKQHRTKCAAGVSAADEFSALFFDVHQRIAGSGFAQDQAGRNIQFTSQNLNGSLSGQINLFDGFANIAALRQSKHNLQASELTYDQTRETVAFDVASNFLLYVNGGQLVVIQQENLEAQRQLLAQIEEFVNVGSRPISDLYQQQAATAQSELDVLNAERDAELSKARLIQGLQLDPRGEYEFVAPRYEDMSVIPQDYNLQELFDIAFRSRDDLAAQEARILAAQQGRTPCKIGVLAESGSGRQLPLELLAG